uniref:Formamidopyrimidine-DNA glycosylase n=1 Tax=Schlesneria paludicola TaxID=360056 RepID=A0A7C2NXY0_9PLAN
MPELPDIVVYQEALSRRIVGTTVEDVRVFSPFLVRTFDPPLETLVGKTVREIQRVGKRIAIGCDDDLWLVLHLMIAGRLHWRWRTKTTKAKRPSKTDLAEFVFSSGTLSLTEAGTQRRASLHLLSGSNALRMHDPGGLEPLTATASEFAARLTRSNHTVKRALTDPHLFSGIGNAYSDEILHAARLSPVALTQKLSDDEIARLYAAVQSTLMEWTNRLRSEAGEEFPERVTAFRKDMAVHGRYGKPCPVCGAPVQRIRYAENETNYCARCQTGGRVLADRSLSRLLKDDWPRQIEDWE